MNRLSLIIFGLILPLSNGFQVVDVRSQSSLRSPVSTSSHVLFHNNGSKSTSKVSSLFANVRFDTIRSSGLKHVQTAGGAPFMLGIKSAKKLVKKAKTLPQDVQNMTLADVKPMKRIKDLHGPITYLFLNFMWARKFPSITKNMFFWLWTAFCIKWYRARYVFKIPVWDRQPNWNNIITSKEQEKDLKAFTCKNCGSTIFIAKSREFFFEGNTGIGGLGCFACGAKGKDNFIMDRDRIVEDVADIDDYFEYERPLDFISAADRRKVLKETGGDEDAANALLVERENAKASTESQAAADAVVNGATGTMEADADDEAMTEDEVVPESVEVEAEEEEEEEAEEPVEEVEIAASSNVEEKKVTKPTPAPVEDDDDLDFLDMDDF
mmetsp:Transcript_13649/g.34314  ORF Transcript_13649/g.34314 Transcript_13649/m.34314 type:complete len:381 (+) Transcript_13649:194-1336(+)